jgi:UDP-N-acetylmuramate dehydrogenase
LKTFNKIQRITETATLNEPMSKHTYYRIGGPAKIYAAPKNASELKEIINICANDNIKFFLLGNGSNILVSDDGFDGCIIDMSANLNEISVSGDKITASAGCTMAKIAKTALKNSLTGFEELAGIPGTVGGALIMNAGCYEKEISELVLEVEILKNGSVERIVRKDINFGYRESSLKDSVVLSAVIQLQKGTKAAVEEKMNQIQSKRKLSQPVHLPSCGSVFKRPPGNFAGKLIEECGLKGRSSGGAMVSNMHAGFIVNTGNATANDVIELIKIIKNEVYSRFSIMLQEEVIFVGFKTEEKK